jgi:hypothetical protein
MAGVVSKKFVNSEKEKIFNAINALNNGSICPNATENDLYKSFFFPSLDIRNIRRPITLLNVLYYHLSKDNKVAWTIFNTNIYCFSRNFLSAVLTLAIGMKNVEIVKNIFHLVYLQELPIEAGPVAEIDFCLLERLMASIDSNFKIHKHEILSLVNDFLSDTVSRNEILKLILKFNDINLNEIVTCEMVINAIRLHDYSIVCFILRNGFDADKFTGNQHKLNNVRQISLYGIKQSGDIEEMVELFRKFGIVPKCPSYYNIFNLDNTLKCSMNELEILLKNKIDVRSELSLYQKDCCDRYPPDVNLLLCKYIVFRV